MLLGRKTTKQINNSVYLPLPLAASRMMPDQPSSAAGSPLTVAPPVDAAGSSPAYILHPPLPRVPGPTPADLGPAVGGAGQTSVPILLNPELMKGTSIPFISPQVRPAVVTVSSH